MRNIKKLSASIKKHIPYRTCVACRQIKPKRELIRLVRVPDGSVEVDITGRKAGRGGYLCHDPKCWEAGLNGGRLEHALGATLTQENRDWLVRYENGLKEPN